MIVKVDGSEEPFDRTKLIHSLRRSGAQDTTINTIVTHIESELSDGISTNDIYRHARALLKKSHKTAAVKYSLRRALFSLGPTGFPFEDFLGQLFQTQGYRTHVGVTIRGTCVEHEVDLLAYKKDLCFVAEAKFHSTPGMKSDLQVALYSHARFQDLKGVRFSKEQECDITDAYIITNTKFTTVATEYAQCVGIKLLSWNYPKDNTLQDHIEKAGVYPITALVSLSAQEKRLLLQKGIVLCKDMTEKREVLHSLGFSPKKIETVVRESVNLCTGG